MAMGKQGVIAGNAFVVIGAIDATGQTLNTISRRLNSWGQSLAAIGAGMMGLGASMMAPIILSANAFVEYDNAMRKVEARSKGSASDMRLLRKEVRMLSEDLVFTASQIGNVAAQISQRGFSRRQVKQMLPGVTYLARGAGEGFNFEEDLSNAGALVTGTLRAFKMEASDAAHVADVYTAAVNNSNFTLLELIDGMKDASTVAERYNMSFEETVATLAMITAVNIPAESASKAVRNMYLRMSNPEHRRKFQENLQAMTGSTVDFMEAGTTNLRKLPDLLFEIGDAIEGLGTAQQGQLLGDLFGLRAMVSAGTVSEARVQWNKLYEQLNDVDDLAKRTADTMDKGLGGALNRLKSVLESIKISVILTLEKALMRVGGSLQEGLKGLRDWIDDNQEFIGGLTLAGAGLFAMGTALLGTGLGLQLAAFAVKGLAIPLAMLSNAASITIGLIGILYKALHSLFTIGITTFTAIATGVMLFTRSLMVLLIAIESVWMTLQVVGAGVGGLIALQSAFSALGAAASTVLGLVAGGAIIVAGVITAFFLLKRVVTDVVASMSAAFTTFWDHLKRIGTTMATSWTSMVRAFHLGDFEASFKIALQGMKVAWLQLIDALLSAWEKFRFELSKSRTGTFARTIAQVGDDLWTGLSFWGMKGKEMAKARAAYMKRTKERATKPGELWSRYQGYQQARDAVIKNEQAKLGEMTGEIDQRWAKKYLEDMGQGAMDAATEFGNTFGNLFNRFSKMFDPDEEMAKAEEGSKAAKETASVILPTAIEAVHRGTVAATKKYYENQRNAIEAKDAKLALMSKMDDKLADIRDRVDFGVI